MDDDEPVETVDQRFYHDFLCQFFCGAYFLFVNDDGDPICSGAVSGVPEPGRAGDEHLHYRGVVFTFICRKIHRSHRAQKNAVRQSAHVPVHFAALFSRAAFEPVFCDPFLARIFFLSENKFLFHKGFQVQIGEVVSGGEAFREVRLYKIRVLHVCQQQ